MTVTEIIDNAKIHDHDAAPTAPSFARTRTRPATLPQMQRDGRCFLTDGGVETTLIFKEGIDLPEFAAFTLLKTHPDKLRDCYRPYIDIAHKHQRGLILESPTWRASKDWGKKIGYDSAALLEQANVESIRFMQDLKDEYHRKCAALNGPDDEDAILAQPIVISGCIGPRGDGYVVGDLMTPMQAKEYHLEQIMVLANKTSADLVSGFTLTYADEAAGMVLAAKEADVPIVISFTLETDAKLPSGETLKEAITKVDELTDGYASYFMINCAHPTHFASMLAQELGGNDDASGEANKTQDDDAGDRSFWLNRLYGVRANASCKSHAELDGATELDEGDPADLSLRCMQLKSCMPKLCIVGGCCGTDERHIEQIALRLSVDSEWCMEIKDE